MKKLLLIPILSIMSINPAMTGEPAKITIREALALAGALRQVDSGPKGAYEFGSGVLRLKMSNDLSIVQSVEQSAEKARQAIVREILNKSGATKIDVGTPDYDEFSTQYNALLDQPAAGTQDLARVKASELKLDKNEIPVTVLSALKPILDIDQ